MVTGIIYKSQPPEGITPGYVFYPEGDEILDSIRDLFVEVRRIPGLSPRQYEEVCLAANGVRCRADEEGDLLKKVDDALKKSGYVLAAAT